MMLISPAHRAFVSFGWRLAWRERVVMSVQLVTYGLLITIFGSIFKITPFNELPASVTLNAVMMIWYLIVTELVTFAGGGQNFHDIRGDILGGQFSASLQRPKSSFRTKMWTWIGTNIVRASVFLLGGTMLGIFFTGKIPYSLTQLPFLLLSIYIGTLIYSAVYFILAAIEVWGPYARPAMWISQKCAFLLGGLILPLQIYPAWLQTLARFTPYPAMLNIPGKIAFAPSLQEMTTSLAIQVFWLIAILAGGFLTQRLAYEHILRKGN